MFASGIKKTLSVIKNSATHYRPRAIHPDWSRASIQRTSLFHPTLCAFIFLARAFLFPAPALAAGTDEKPEPMVLLPQVAISAKQLAVVYSSDDELSQQVARYYAKRRGVPDENVIGLPIKTGDANLSREQFDAVKTVLDARLKGKDVEGLLLTWTAPYRVDCMSITSAFALGFDKKYCSKGCEKTALNPYTQNMQQRTFSETGMRPTMLLPYSSLHDAKALIERGISADYSRPKGKAALLSTSDKNRNVRSGFYPQVKKAFNSILPVQIIKANSIRDRKDLMFYFTGLSQVKDIDSNHFLPGAMADHLTSSGGQLTATTGQMSATRWLEAGATGSYGTVVEPCNFLQKFPNPTVAMYFYLTGSTLLESYWKSVLMPGQGVFIGEPLARPYAFTEMAYRKNTLSLRSSMLRPGHYLLEGSNLGGEFETLIPNLRVKHLWEPLKIPVAYRAVYRLRRVLD